MPEGGARLLCLCRRRGLPRIAAQALRRVRSTAGAREETRRPTTGATVLILSGPEARLGSVSRSGNVVEGIGHLERPLGGTAGEVAVLVADVGDDLDLLLVLDRRARSGLVFCNGVRIARLLQDEIVPILVANRSQVSHGVRALFFAAGADEEYLEALRLRHREQCQG